MTKRRRIELTPAELEVRRLRRIRYAGGSQIGRSAAEDDEEDVQISKVLPGYKIIEEFPKYEINCRGTVRYRELHRTVKSRSGSVSLMKDGETYSISIMVLLDHYFPGKQVDVVRWPLS